MNKSALLQSYNKTVALAKKLNNGTVVVSIHLWGMKHAEDFNNVDVNPMWISTNSDFSNSYYVEINKGISMAWYLKDTSIKDVITIY